MKAPRGFVCVLALLVAVSSFAESPKKQAFGPLNFGDTPQEAKANLEKLLSGYKSPMTAADAQKHLVTSTVKSPATLAGKQKSLTINLRMSPAASMNWVEVESYPQQHAANYQDVRAAWEILRDICQSKFGQPTTTSTFPPVASLVGKSFTFPTDVWDLPGMKVTVGVKFLNVPGNPDYTATIRVEDTSVGAAVTVR